MPNKEWQTEHTKLAVHENLLFFLDKYNRP